MEFLSAALAAQEITRVHRIRQCLSMSLIGSKFRTLRKPISDLRLDLLNLLGPTIAIQPRSFGGARRAAHAINRRECWPSAQAFSSRSISPSQANCAPEIDDYWYYIAPDGKGFLRRRFKIVKDAMNTGDPFPGGGEAELRDSLELAQIVVLEENHSVITGRIEVDDLLHAARALP